MPGRQFSRYEAEERRSGEMALDFVAGCLGGCAGILVGYPLDTVKIHMQTQNHRNPKYRGTWHCFRTLLAKESVTGLYRGMSSPIAGVAAVNAIVFGVYGHTQKHFSEPDHLTSHFLAGASAGIAQTPVCSPIELAKTRLQLQSPSENKFSGPVQCLVHVYRSEGYRGVFKGLGITFLREAPSYGAYFLTYEALTRSEEPVSTPCMLLAGGLAGTVSWVISYPLDVIKSRIQAETGGRYSGALDCLRKSVKTEGYTCLYRGLNSTILRAFPTNAATFAVVTWTFRIFGEEPNERAAPRVARGEESASGEAAAGTDEREPFLNKWNSFLKTVSSQPTLSRSYYSGLSAPSAEALLANSIESVSSGRDKAPGLSITRQAVKRSEEDTGRMPRGAGPRLSGENLSEESATEGKVEWLVL